MEVLDVKTTGRTELVEITHHIKKIIAQSGCRDGLVTVFTPHTTGAITINENADPDVMRDINTFLNSHIPQNHGFKHAEGNSDSHIKSSLMGCSETLIIDNGVLQLGTWQGVYFCEFDGPRQRKVWVKIIGE